MSNEQDELDKIFATIAAVKPMNGGLLPRPSLGRHILDLDQYFVKPSKVEGEGSRLLANFKVATSTSDEVGTSKEWPWFIQASGNKWTKVYEQDRSKEFIANVIESIGQDAVGEILKEAGVDLNRITDMEKMIHALGLTMVRKAQPLRGLQVAVEVVLDPRGGVNKKTGERYTIAKWAVARKQSLAEIRANGARLAALEAGQADAPADKPAEKAAEPATTTPTGGASMFRFGTAK